MYLFSFLVLTVLLYTAQSLDFTLLDLLQVIQATRSVVLVISSDKEIKQNQNPQEIFAKVGYYDVSQVIGVNENPEQNNVFVSPYRVNNVSIMVFECSKSCPCVSQTGSIM